MALGVIEWFALIIAVVSIIKLIFIVTNKKAWFKIVKPIYAESGMTWVFGILALATLYYLLQSMTIVQIFAVSLFMALFIGMAYSAYPQHFSKFAETIIKAKIPGAIWVFSLIWLVLSLWVIFVLFM